MEQANHIRAALVGNPNSGKSSLFNALTGLKQKVGNFPGVTVDKLVGSLKLPSGKKLELVDLPGTYSLNPRSADEQVVRNAIINPEDTSHPQLIIAVIDASSLRRSLFLVTQIIDAGIPVVGVLNMGDVAEDKGMQIDMQGLETALGIRICQVNALRDKKFDELLSLVDRQSVQKSAPTAYEAHLHPDVDKLISEFQGFDHFSIYNLLLNQDANDFLSDHQKNLLVDTTAGWEKSVSARQLEEISHRYEVIAGIAENVLIEADDHSSHKKTDRIDKVLTHKIWGTLAFLFIFFLLFQSVFSLAEYPMIWIDEGMGALKSWVGGLIPEGWVNDFIVGGILSGIAGVVVFIPQIAILFGLITILEDSGYMARVSFINDGLLKKVGMNGKSIVPLVGGFACAVPAIMAARSIENKKERLITILVTPLMSCSARLPVYVFLIAFIVPDDKVWGFLSLQGLFMLGLYLLGIVTSAIVALVISQFIKSNERQSFIMELPTYKSPRLMNVLNSMFNKSRTFVVEAGKIILVVSIILWFLASFGPGNSMDEAEAEVTKLELSEADLGTAIQSARMEASYAGHLGKLIEPAIEPLGFDWKIGIAVVTSFAAREVFVGTMSTIYGIDETDDEDLTIAAMQDKLMNEVNPVTGRPLMTMATALSLIMFYVFAMQCMSTVAIVKKETGGWKWPVVMFVYMTLIAYVASLVTYQLLA